MQCMGEPSVFFTKGALQSDHPRAIKCAPLRSHEIFKDRFQRTINSVETLPPAFQRSFSLCKFARLCLQYKKHTFIEIVESSLRPAFRALSSCSNLKHGLLIVVIFLLPFTKIHHFDRIRRILLALLYSALGSFKYIFRLSSRLFVPTARSLFVHRDE